MAVINLRNELLYGVYVRRGYVNLEGLHGGFLKNDSVRIAVRDFGLLVSHWFVLCVCDNLLLIIVFLSLDQVQDPLGDNVAARFRHRVVLGYEVLQRRDGALQVGNFHGGICLVVDLGLLDFDIDFVSSAQNC